MCGITLIDFIKWECWSTPCSKKTPFRKETPCSKKEHLVVKNIPRIGKLPYGEKRGFIERKALLKKGFIEIKALFE